MNDAINAVAVLLDYLISNWQVIAAYLGIGGVVAVVLQAIKHQFKIFDAKKTVTALLGILSVAASLVEFVVVGGGSQITNMFGQHAAVIMSSAVIMHRFFVSPLYSRLVVTLGSLLDDASSYRKLTQAATPVQPVAPTPVIQQNQAPVNQTFEV